MDCYTIDLNCLCRYYKIVVVLHFTLILLKRMQNAYVEKNCTYGPLKNSILKLKLSMDFLFLFFLGLEDVRIRP